MLDLVQALSDHMGQVGKLDEDSAHWVGVAVRESVINAIKHGNKEDDKKRVSVEFRFEPIEEPTQFVVRILDQGEGVSSRSGVRILDQGEGFNPVEVADPLEPENLLKSSGRGIFFMRSFMDDVTLRTAPEGGTEVRMVKKLG